MSLPPIDLAVFHENGYVRKQCRVTSLWFWTADPDRDTCGDTEEDEYTFIGAPLIAGFDQRGKALKDAMREAFLGFFEAENHARIDPYPVLARWRDDIHLTIASIADFQPHVTSGAVDPPANPLTVSQPCIRLTDVDAVGRSGRHLTTFEMMAHHVFNRPEDGLEIYWMETCVELCHRMLTDTFGIDAKEVTYVENPWCGGGNAGAAVEVIVGGLELATLVFMDMEEHPEGDVELKYLPNHAAANHRHRLRLGRFCWAAAGTPTIYEAIYPETVDWLKELSGFDQVTSRWPSLDLDGLLGEMSRLNGIMNIEAGVDGDQLVNLFFSNSKRGVELTAEQFSSGLRATGQHLCHPDHLHALCNMLGDGLFFGCKGGLPHGCLHEGSFACETSSALMFPFRTLPSIISTSIWVAISTNRPRQVCSPSWPWKRNATQKMLRKGTNVIKPNSNPFQRQTNSFPTNTCSP